jgi:hypothetical protein
LGRQHLASSFLLCDNPRFQIRELLERARRSSDADSSQRLTRDILLAIEPFDVAGLGHRGRGNWYPAAAEDMLRGAAKLNATREEVERVLARCGFKAAAQ